MSSSASTGSLSRASFPLAAVNPPNQNSTSGKLALRIKDKARALGFDLVGITTIDSPQHATELRQWLADDFHGEMSYMAKNADKRVAPGCVLPGAQSIVVVGMNYYTGDHESG